MKIEKESDALYREYRQLVRMAERLTRKYPYSDQIYARMNEIFQRQKQIVKELEESTGIAIISDWTADWTKK
jgi:hypothetical protein